MSGVVVVGAGIAGVRAAESLRTSGYLGDITLIGDEAPIYRPSISKEALTEGSQGTYPMPMKQGGPAFNWRLGSTVHQLDLSAQALTYQDSAGDFTQLEFDGLVVASGMRPRRLPVTGPEKGRYMLRTLAQAQDLAHQLRPGTRLTIVGSGFIGCEVAAAARARGCAVTVISAASVPLASAVGVTIGQIVTQRHITEGVHFALERSVREYRGDSAIREVVLDDGQVIGSDLVLEAVGSQPNVEWLEGQGLDTADGVLADGQLRAVGTSAAVLMCGDLARHPNALFGSQARRVEHWTAAADTGAYAGRAMARLLESGAIDLPAFAVVPSFWSDQYDLQIQSFGFPHLATEQQVIELNADGSCIIECSDSQGLVAAIGINRTPELARYRKSFSSRYESTGLLSEDAQPH